VPRCHNEFVCKKIEHVHSIVSGSLFGKKEINNETQSFPFVHLVIDHQIIDWVIG